MSKFNINQLKSYFINSNSTNKSYKDLSKEEMVSLAVLSLFDKSGKKIQVGSTSYEKQDGVISQEEFNMTQKEYEKMAKSIQKQLKKELGRDIKFNIPSYEDLQAMMNDDKKISADELKIYAQNGVIKHSASEAPKPVVIPDKKGDNKLTLEEKKEYLQKAFADPAVNEILDAVEAKFANSSVIAYDFTPIKDGLAKVQKNINEFKPKNDVAYNKQDPVTLDGSQYNSNGQVVTRINNSAGVYEKYIYPTADKDAPYSEMMRYNANGYKTEYFRREELTGADGKKFIGSVMYKLDENENIIKITYPPNTKYDQIFDDFNDYNLYNKIMEYGIELEDAGMLPE